MVIKGRNKGDRPFINLMEHSLFFIIISWVKKKQDFVISRVYDLFKTVQKKNTSPNMWTKMSQTDLSTHRLCNLKESASWKMTIPFFIADLPKTLLFHSRICMSVAWNVSHFGEISQKHVRLWAHRSTGVWRSTAIIISDI